ncbi:unnamed protein product [Mytilus coruscus]|uniref:Transposase domain-containing protein n=1 Tax=Mytilus coruscus TaxID=42192 RepID=A0A6J8A504_MYTCO|nr:unnamed protein product [Mytilus coruscus]
MADEYNMKKKRKRGPYREKEIIKKDGLPIPVLTLNGPGPALDLTSNESTTEQLHENYIFESEVNQSFVIEDEIQNNLFFKKGPEASMLQSTIDHGDLDAITFEQATEIDLKSDDPELDDILKSLYEETIELEDPFELWEDSNEDEHTFTNFDQNDDLNSDLDLRPLYPGASVTVGAFMLLLALFTTNFGVSSEGTQVLLNIIAFALPFEHNLCTKLHEFKKFFTNLRIPLVKHFYCGHCLGAIENTSLKNCPYEFCKKPFSKNDGNYFLEIPLQNQIQNLFSQENFYERLQHRFTRNTPDGTYEDIYDGKIYKSLNRENGLLSNPDNISFTFNTDGAAVFKSSKVSVWPIFLVINELPYKLRMKRENMILASLWFGSQKPAMGTFLKPFQHSMKNLYNGIECFSPKRGAFLSKGILLCGTADLPARSILCNHIQYNGAYSCWKCEQQGTSAAVGKGQTRVFPFDEANPKGPERTVHNVIENAHQALNGTNGASSVVKGIKGPSWLSFFPEFDIVNGIAIDYMHGVLLGVQKLLLELWFAQKHSSQPFNFFQKLCQVDERLIRIRPTTEITRLPRTIQNDLKYWKASEYRSFLLYYGAPVLHGILDRERWSHYLLLVNAMHVLLKYGSTDEEVNEAELYLLEFCKNFPRLYNGCYMRLNIHQLLHLADCVRNLGPLYTHSCFSSEDKNGALIRMIRGTQNIDSQIVTGVSFLQKLPELKQNCIEKGSVCETLYNSMECPYILKRMKKIGNIGYILGGIKEITLSASENVALHDFFGYELIQMKFQCFKRLELKDCIVYGKSYTRMVKRDNSVIEYNCRGLINYGQVKFFINLVENEQQYYLAFIEKLRCGNYAPKSNILRVSKTTSLEVIPIENITTSCMLVTYDGAQYSYICKFPNKMEFD